MWEGNLIGETTGSGGDHLTHIHPIHIYIYIYTYGRGAFENVGHRGMGLRLDVYEVGPVCDLSSGSARKVEVLPAKINMMTDVVPTGLLALFVWMPWVFLHRAGGIAFLRLW